MSPSDTCLSCDTETQLTPHRLCGPCRDELRFILRPAAHRETYRRRVAAEASIRTEMERLGVVIVSSVPDDNTFWVCDLCNNQIPVEDDYTLIPLLGSYALCAPCVTTIPYWPDAWLEPTPRACRCGACQTPLLQLSMTEGRTGRSLDGPTSDRGLEQ